MAIKYYVCWAYGNCNDGSCDRGFDEFDTYEEAAAKFNQGEVD